MFARVVSASAQGIDALRVDVEVDVSPGQIPTYRVVGLPAASIKEGGMRIRAALDFIGQGLPARRITVNLAPADERKNGAALDLPIAIGVLCADQDRRLRPPDNLLVTGELGLDGSVRPIPGALAAAELARRLGCRGLIVPEANGGEAACVDGLTIYTATHLGEVVAFLDGSGDLPVARPTAPGSATAKGLDMMDVRGQPLARFGVEVAVAGGHNLLLLGPPGAGKTMLARRVPSLLPPLSRDQAIETTKIYSSIGQSGGALVTERPFRAPHHTSSVAGLVGGGSPPRPGEISLAHGGVLFLDELAEFSRTALETLRQPLESGRVAIGRAVGMFEFPAAFMLIAAANPCPCGWHGTRERVCTCSPSSVERYRKRLSGPLLDRIDLQLRVRSVGLLELRGEDAGEPSAKIRERVLAARDRQLRRLFRHGFETNAEMDSRALRETCRLDSRAEKILERLYAVRGFTARGLHRILKVARTIADLAERSELDAADLVEASNLRALESEPIADPRQRRAG